MELFALSCDSLQQLYMAPSGRRFMGMRSFALEAQRCRATVALAVSTASIIAGCSSESKPESSGIGTSGNDSGEQVPSPISMGGETPGGIPTSGTETPSTTQVLVVDEPGEMVETKDPKAVCTGVTQEAERVEHGNVDIIFVIDNSSTMTGEIMQVENRINEDFAKIIGDSGVDYRVIMLSRYGKNFDPIGDSDNPICIRAPLGAGTCADPNSEVLQHNPPTFFHHSLDQRSRQALCDILEAYDAPDELLEPRVDPAREAPMPRQFDWKKIAPNGFKEWLRPESLKHFVIISDDQVKCKRLGYDFVDRETAADGMVAAEQFHAALTTLAPEQFGTAAKPQYVMHSIVGMTAKPPGPDGISPAWQPNEPIQEGQCGEESVANGTGFQAISVMTGGLRYPSCLNDNFDEIFREIAFSVVDGALSCAWEIPPPPKGETLDPSKVNLLFDPGGAEPAYNVPSVGSEADCGPEGGWFYDNPAAPTEVRTCPSTCGVFKKDVNGKVDITFGCSTVIAKIK